MAEGNSVFTDEQLKILLEMGDITEAEREMYKQQALASQLTEGMYKTKGRDVGSNLARAFSGIGGAVGQHKASEKGTEISNQYRTLMDKLYGPKLPTTMPAPQQRQVVAQAATQPPIPQYRQPPVPQDQGRSMPAPAPSAQMVRDYQSGMGASPNIQPGQSRPIAPGQMSPLAPETVAPGMGATPYIRPYFPNSPGLNKQPVLDWTLDEDEKEY
jgi:hypothetical protein